MIPTWLKKIFSKKHKNHGSNILASTTTVVAVKFRSSVVLGTEGLLVASEFGLVIRKNTPKVVYVSKDIAIGCSGDAEFIEALHECLVKDMIGRGINVDEVDAAEVVRDVKLRMEKHWKLHATHIGVLVVSVKNNTSSIIKLETAANCGEVFETPIDDDERYETVGSGGPCAETYLNRHMVKYPLGTEDREERMKVVIDALKFAVKKDWGSGGRLHVVSINGNKSRYEVFESQVGGSCCNAVYKRDPF